MPKLTSLNMGVSLTLPNGHKLQHSGTFPSKTFATPEELVEELLAILATHGVTVQEKPRHEKQSKAK